MFVVRTRLSQIHFGDTIQRPVRMQVHVVISRPAFRSDPAAISQFHVPRSPGQVALTPPGEIGFGCSPSQVDRLDRSRNAYGLAISRTHFGGRV